MPRNTSSPPVRGHPNTAATIPHNPHFAPFRGCRGGVFRLSDVKGEHCGSRGVSPACCGVFRDAAITWLTRLNAAGGETWGFPVGRSGGNGRPAPRLGIDWDANRHRRLRAVQPRRQPSAATGVGPRRPPESALGGHRGREKQRGAADSATPRVCGWTSVVEAAAEAILHPAGE